MKPGAIAIVRENARFELEQSLKALGNSFDADVKLLVEISVRYHLLASAFLLEDSDQRGFACLLALSGQTDLYLRGQDLSAHPRWLAASHSLPFADALAAGDLATAGAIARLAPSAWLKGHEYEDDFLQAHLQHRLLVAPDDEAALRAILTRWEAVVGSAGSAELDAARALVDRDVAALEDALHRVVHQRQTRLAAWRRRPDYRDTLDATEGAIFVPGLALLRLAELRGLEIRREYDLLPGLARVAAGGVLPGPGEWAHGFAGAGIA